jgi:hypothetical protein
VASESKLLVDDPSVELPDEDETDLRPPVHVTSVSDG